MKALGVVDAGTVPYRTALTWQLDLHARRLADEIADVVLLLEHPHVYTLGRRFAKEHLLSSEEVLRAQGIDVVETDRGGSVTYHGPGQLIAYPILDLRRPGQPYPDAIRYLRQLEEAIIRTVRGLDIAAGRREGLTGVWVGNAKLASIGVNVSRGVTRHGFALNVSTDLRKFEMMVPCGIPECEMTSLEVLLRRPIGVAEVFDRSSRHLAKVLHRRATPMTLAELGLSATSPDTGDARMLDAKIIDFPGAAEV